MTMTTLQVSGDDMAILDVSPANAQPVHLYTAGLLGLIRTSTLPDAVKQEASTRLLALSNLIELKTSTTHEHQRNH